MKTRVTITALITLLLLSVIGNVLAVRCATQATRNEIAAVEQQIRILEDFRDYSHQVKQKRFAENK